MTVGDHKLEPRTRRQHSERREVRGGFYSLATWRRFRRMFLRRFPVCAHCHARGITTPASQVDHVIPRAERMDLELEESNAQALCLICHTDKTNRERTGRCAHPETRCIDGRDRCTWCGVLR